MPGNANTPVFIPRTVTRSAPTWIPSAAPETSAEFHRAEEIYLRILHEVRLHEEDWLTEFVLELADVLAEWSVPPPGAEQQINCFLERVRVSLDRIHTEMRRIDIKLGETEGS